MQSTLLFNIYYFILLKTDLKNIFENLKPLFKLHFFKSESVLISIIQTVFTNP